MFYFYSKSHASHSVCLHNAEKNSVATLKLFLVSCHMLMNVI